MLIKVESECPECEATIQLTVSAGERGKTVGSVTSCSACGARLVTQTEDAVRVTVFGPTGDRALEFTLMTEPTSSGGHVRPDAQYVVFAPKHLDLMRRDDETYVEPPSVSDDDLANSISRLDGGFFRRPDGSPRTPAEVARQLGWRTVWIAQLNLAIQQRLAGPPPITTPPTVFVSYRWGSTEENAWVAALAVELKRRGYPVIFDQDQPQGDNVDVPGMVSRLAECRYVLCVIDPGYVERLGHEPGSSTKDGWVFDEVNTASAFSNAGRLALIGLLRDGDQLPQGFSFMGPNQRGNSVDVRGSNRLAAFLNDVLPELPGEHDTATVAAARAALADSHAAYLAGDPERAFAEAARVKALLPDAPDGYAQTIRLALRTGMGAGDAVEAAEFLAERGAGSTELHAAAALLYHGARVLDRAARHARLAIDRSDSDPERGVAHTILGDVLDEHDSLDAALGHARVAIHLRGCFEEQTLTKLGYYLRRLGRPDEALEAFAAALEDAPDSPNLLTNAAAAAFEAGDIDRFRTHALRLHEVAPGSPGANVIQDLFVGGQFEPHPLVPLTREIEVAGVAACASCQTSIRLAAGELVCAGCGAPRPVGVRQCPVCDHDGVITPGLLGGVSWACPVCRERTLKYKAVEA